MNLSKTAPAKTHKNQDFPRIYQQYPPFFHLSVSFLIVLALQFLLYRKASNTESEKPAKQVLVDRAPERSADGEGASQVADGSKIAVQKEVSLPLTYIFHFPGSEQSYYSNF